MAIVAIYTPEKMSLEQYYGIVRHIEQAGLSEPPGRLYHVCYGKEGELWMLEVWESQGELDAYREQILPILKVSGVIPGQSEVTTVQNIIA